MPEWGNGTNLRAQVDMESPDNGECTLKVRNVNEAGGGANKVGIETANSNTGANARALKATGMSEIVANSLNNPASTALKLTNQSGNQNARALEVTHGRVILGVICPVEASGAHNLVLGTGVTQQVMIGLNGHRTQVQGHLRVVQEVVVGPGNGPGTITADNTLGAQDLNVGVHNATRNVNLSRVGQMVQMVDRVRVQNNAAGDVNVILNGQEAQNINDPLARGFADNPAGHPEWGGMGPSVDHYINGQVRWFEDWNGVHNVP